MAEPRTRLVTAAGLLRPVPTWASAVALAGLCLALVGAISPFHRCTPRRRANENAAIATLHNIASAQQRLQDSGAIDDDGDGRGEYGFLAELAGAAVGRARLEPALLSAAFGKVTGGRVHRSGYVFACFLRGRDGTWLAEAGSGGAVGLQLDADAAERDWRVLAWPSVSGSSGVRTFGIDAHRGLCATAAARELFGGDDAPAAEALDDARLGWQPVR